ncbi:hypothetical protein MMC06_003080 [Schaereria dolodes]|nr:hypothetical protein [Schaereria dolodes]
MDRLEELPSCLQELMAASTCYQGSSILVDGCTEHHISLSTLERIIVTCPPVVESLLLQLPTSSVLNLYHTSRSLRSFLQSYPIAWKYLSFRTINNKPNAQAQTQSGSELSSELLTQRSKPYALDQLLVAVVVPYSSCLCNLDLDNTAVSGLTLTSTILPAQRNTLQHLSVRGCKNVSLKYHIVPYLTVFSLQKAVNSINPSFHVDKLALKSLYAYRCRNHRRRPYLPGSLLKRDSDSEPTHEFIKICYNLEISTDTAWCPTPGGRCQRRKDYYTARGDVDGRGQVWVVFDRLWRSSNRIGKDGHKLMRHDGAVWEEAECGHDGEALGGGYWPNEGEGKTIPTHLRRSHKVFVERFKCDICEAPITERCESCSVRMHCMGCRKTLCASCAYSRPLPPKEVKTTTGASRDTASIDDKGRDEFWWAPGETRNPNIMQELTDGNPYPANPGQLQPQPRLNLRWCCSQPTCSGTAAVALGLVGMDGNRTSRIHTAPLPRGKGWEDLEFVRLRQDDQNFPKGAYAENDSYNCTSKDGHDRLLQWLLCGRGEPNESSCSRNLCQECYETKGWQAECHACHVPFCIQHEFRGLKMRVCGYGDLHKEQARLHKKQAIAKLVVLAEDALAMRSQEGKYRYLAPIVQRIREFLIKTIAVVNPVMPRVASVECLLDDCDSFETKDSQYNEISGIDTVIVDLTAQLDRLSRRAQTAHAKSKHEEPRWHGCAAFLCPEYRPVGDYRPRCTAEAKICTVCSVVVCPACLIKNVACTCTFCIGHYRCPKCFAETTGPCMKVEEDRQAKEKAKLQELRRALSRLSKERADDAAEQVGAFFEGVEGRGNGVNEQLDDAGDDWTIGPDSWGVALDSSVDYIC